MPTNIPMELLRTFTAIADSGSFSQAADQVGRSQSAVSMQIKRLEELIAKPPAQTGQSEFKTDGRRPDPAQLCAQNPQTE